MSDLYQSYFIYLTNRLDKGISQNIVPPTVAKLCKQQWLSDKGCKILDIGCFNGSMLNRTLMILPQKIRRSINSVGFDIDNRALTIGAQQHPHINFVCGAIEQPLPFHSSFNIVILSNILHELYSSKKRQFSSDSVAKTYVAQAIKDICQTLSSFGSLVILEGVLPQNPEKKLIIEFQNEAILNEFKELCSNFAFPISYLSLEKYIIELSARHLAVFLTKARYLHEDYWPLEATQVYQFMTEKEFHEILKSAGMSIEESKIMPQPLEIWHSKLRILTQDESYPPKNILIVAKKISTETRES